MSQEDQYQRMLARAAFARNLKASPDFADLISAMQSRIATEWAVSQTVEKREQQHAKLTALNDLVLELHSWADAGTLATAKRDADEAANSSTA